MTTQTSDISTPEAKKPASLKPLRLWPGVIAAVVLLVARYLVPYFAPELAPLGMGIAALAILAIILWWVFFSRLPWVERLGAIVLVAVAFFITYRLVHVSIRTGAMGFLFPVLALPPLSLALVVWAYVVNRLSVSGRLSNTVRRGSLVMTILLVCAAFMLIRTGGFTGDFKNDLAWRWSQTHEERLLAQADDELSQEPIRTVTDGITDAGWSGFRGPGRDSVVRGTQIQTDWSASPPVELWRRPIGPGWSSFAVSGDLIYTQEQRGEHEIVACYNLTNGRLVWRHQDAARFWESNAGPGPRSTPSLSDGRVYTFGATGIVNALDAGNGRVVWSRNAAADTETKTPGWGFSSSPLVVDDLVIIATSGNLIAYDITNGQPRWSHKDGGGSYSSPHLATIAATPQVLLINGPGTISVSPADGKVLWEYPLFPRGRICQPALTADGDVLVAEGEGNGMIRLTVGNGPDGWKVTERWTSEGLNPYFNDFVVSKGHAFGFDGSSLACIDLNDGNRKWKGGRFGHGQLVLLADQDLLLVLSEDGELALVKADPNQFIEFARIPAIKGKTWNHPVLVRDILLVRNGEEMAAFRLPRASS